jgi:hypothetical protein
MENEDYEEGCSCRKAEVFIDEGAVMERRLEGEEQER